MKLAEMDMTKYLGLLASGEPAPGGGSAAALSCAQGLALVKMVAALTAEKEKYAQTAGLMEEIKESAAVLMHQALSLVDRDTEAYNCVCAVFPMPKNTQVEKDVRSAAMQTALKGCTQTPMETMRCALEGLRLAHRVLPCFNTNAASDLGVAALHLKTAVQGGWLNVAINLGGVRDAEFCAQYREEGRRVLREALTLSDAIYCKIEGELQ